MMKAKINKATHKTGDAHKVGEKNISGGITEAQHVSRKAFLAVLAASVLLLAALVTTLALNALQTADTKFIIINESIFESDKMYFPQGESIFAVNLEKKVGVTDLKQQVYKISGMDTGEWICVRNDGDEVLFKEKSVEGFSVESFNPDVIVIKDADAVGGAQTTVTDKNTIKAVVSKLNDKYATTARLNLSSMKKVEFFSQNYPGLGVVLYYLHDADGNCYLVNMDTNDTWQIGHELMGYIM